MRRGLPTASALHRAFVCIASAVLPVVREENKYGERGTTIHTFLENVNRSGRDLALAAIGKNDAEVLAVCEAIEVDALPLNAERFVPEIAFAWDPMTGEGRELGRGLKRNYKDADPQRENRGTADTGAVVDGRAAYIIDWKSGITHQPAPAAHRQMRLLGLMAARAWGLDEAIIEIIRIEDDGRAWRERDTLDMMQLAEIAEEHRELDADILRHQDAYEEGTLPPMTVGDHCSGCAAKRMCPARTTIMAAAAGNPLAFRDRVGKELESGNARAAYHAVKALKKLWEDLDGDVRQYAEDHPFEVSDDGRIYGPKMVTYENLNPNVVWHSIRDLFGEEAAFNATTLKAPKTGDHSIDTVARAVAKDTKRKIAHVTRDIIAEVDRRGGLTRIQKREVRLQPAPKSRAMPVAAEQALLTAGIDAEVVSEGEVNAEA